MTIAGRIGMMLLNDASGIFSMILLALGVGAFVLILLV